jgi:hypothetical protein
VLGRGSYGVVYELLPLASASLSASSCEPIAVKVRVRLAWLLPSSDCLHRIDMLL